MHGQELGSYQILSLLGAGGMGVVYKARDVRLNRSVVIKVSPPGKVSDPQRKRRFIQEGKAASALNHSNIITIYDVESKEDHRLHRHGVCGCQDARSSHPAQGDATENEALKVATKMG